ncbi:hypothetical protein PanWU01x14_027720 [Parasponia andersonii]|uniref:Uncharacterized protein n=1 Tax=Parasponia andersonii TaxID=3476 RepID=A0A2P5DV28_PARAD|nr:hypothetical protein PanWU01x14_027720 [Parasponia andersonii]
MASSRITTRSTRPNADGNPPDAEGSSWGVQPRLEQKLDQILAALAEASRKAKIAYEVIMGLKDEVAEVRMDNAHLEGLLASEARSERREDFDAEVQQETEGQPPREMLAPSRSRMQGEQQSRTRPFRARAAEPERQKPEDTKKALNVCFPIESKK